MMKLNRLILLFLTAIGPAMSENSIQLEAAAGGGTYPPAALQVSPPNLTATTKAVAPPSTGQDGEGDWQEFYAPLSDDPGRPPTEVAAAYEEPKKKEGDKSKEKKKEEEAKVFDYSGHHRMRGESWQNFDLVYSRDHLAPEASDNDDNFFLSQFRLNLDFKPSKYFHAHVTLQDAREFGSHQIDHDELDKVFRNTFENKTDVYEAWVKLKLGEAPLSLQVGRQELIYGDRRLIGQSRWRNTGRSFDAWKLIYEQDNVKLDLFLANRVLVDSNAWDHADHNDNFMGAYATIKELPQGVQDFYLLRRDDDNRHIEEYTLGTRIAGDSGPWDWNLEGVYQWGSSVDTVRPTRGNDLFLDHEAWAAHAEFGYTCENHPLKPRIALEYDYATGDEDPFDNENNTFDQLYPNNHTPFGIMDFVGWKNVEILAPKLSWQQSKKLKMGIDWFFYWLPEPRDDAWYDSGGRSFRNAAGAPVSDFLGHELNLLATYKLSDDCEIETGFGHFFAGDLAADTAPIGGGADDANFVYLQTTYKF